MCTEPSWLLFGPNPIWNAIANSGISEPWCSVYQVWWLNIVAVLVVILVAVSGASRAFPLLYQRFIHDIQVKTFSESATSTKSTEQASSPIQNNVNSSAGTNSAEPFKTRKELVAMIALLLVFTVCIVGIAISNRPSLLIWSLGVNESQQVYHLSKDGNDYLLGALRQVAYAMLSAWFAALLIGVFILPPHLSSAKDALSDWFGPMLRDFFAETGESPRSETKAGASAGTDDSLGTSGSTLNSSSPHTYWRAYQSRKNFETPKINLHAETPEKDEEFDGTGEKMTLKKLRAEKFWLSRDGLHLWLREPPQDADNETEETTDFKLIWHSVKQCYMAQAKKVDDKTFELDSSANYCDLPIPKFVLELEKVAYHVQVKI